MRNILLGVVLAGIASLVLVQAQAQSRNPLAACLANCPSCPPRGDRSFDPECDQKQRNCKVECERQGQYSPPAGGILLAQGKNEPACQQACAKTRRECTGDYPKPDQFRACEAAETACKSRC